MIRNDARALQRGRIARAGLALFVCAGALILTGCGSNEVAGAEAKTVRVTIADGCPSQLGRALDVTNPVKYAMLVPAPLSPVSGLVCNYSPSSLTLPDSPIPGAFASTVLDETPLNHAKAQIIANSVAQLSLAGYRGLTDCPDTQVGSAAIIVLRYAGLPDVDLWYHNTGCLTLDDGHHISQASASPNFYAGFAVSIAILAQVP